MKVLIMAYINGNLGDDLFIQVLCERYPQHTFYLIGAKQYQNYFNSLDNLRYICLDSGWVRRYVQIRKKFEKLCKKESMVSLTLVRKLFKRITRLTVLIGGSVFIESPNWRYEIRDREMLFDSKTYLLGCNFGPYQSAEYLDAYRKLLSNVQDICFRDSASYKYFSSLPNARVGSDILFGLSDTGNSEEEYYIISVVKVGKESDLIESEQMYFLRMAELADYILEKGYGVILMSFCKAEGDMEAASLIKEKVYGKDKVKVINHANIHDSLNIIKGARGIVATRFHAMILGLVYKKHIYPVLYSNKMKNVLEDIKYTGKYCKVQDLESVTAKDVWDALHIKYDCYITYENANEQFKQLDAVLK